MPFDISSVSLYHLCLESLFECVADRTNGVKGATS